MKSNKRILWLLCGLIGIVYFTGFSQLEVNGIIRNYLAIVPLQIAALCYVFYVYWMRGKPEL